MQLWAYVWVGEYACECVTVHVLVCMPECSSVSAYMYVDVWVNMHKYVYSQAPKTTPAKAGM